jgi:hypothetical protein
MNAIRNDLPQSAQRPTSRFEQCWKQLTVRNPEHAAHASQTVLRALKSAAYGQREVEGMRIALDEAIANSLSAPGVQGPEAMRLVIRYRVNASYAAVEVERCRAAGRSSAGVSSRRPQVTELPVTPVPPSIYSYMTWIRYSKKDQSATICRCSLLK